MGMALQNGRSACRFAGPFPKGLSYNSPAKWQVGPAKWQGRIPDSKQQVVRPAVWQGGPAVLQGHSQKDCLIIALQNGRSDLLNGRAGFQIANNQLLEADGGTLLLQGLLYSSTCKMVCCPAQWRGGPAMWQVVKRLIPVDKKYHAHLTSNSNITFALDVIKNKLSKGMDKLKDSFVGKFLELKTVQFCGGFIHLLLLNQVECDDTNVMEFDFHGIGARFDRKSFAMIMGLNCGKFSNEKELEHLPYDLWVKYFGDTGPMSQSDFIKAFEDLDFDESDEEVENNVKCCMFYFLEADRLGTKRMVRNRNFNIIQNNELCDRYPWGNLSYDVTISNLRSRIKEGQQITNYSVSGFPLAFQIWGFETIPAIVTLAPRGKYHGVMCPRMLGWSCPSTLQYTKLAAEVFDRNDYIVKNELHPTAMELQQTYMKGFWHRPSDRKYYGPPVFRADTSQSQPTVLPSLIETITNEGTQTASHPPSDQISDLKLQITELRSDLVAMRTELRSELQQQRNEIQNISSLVRQLVDQFAPKALVVAVWDPYTSVDDEQRAALTAFLDDQSTQFHVVEYDMMDKSSFNLILTSGGWLRDQEIDAAMYYIRKRITNNPQLFDQRYIVTDCMFWASMHGRYVKYLKKSPNKEEDELTKDADWEKEMRDSPFDMYALGMLPVGSKSWLEIDYVSICAVNNDKETPLAPRSTSEADTLHYTTPTLP
ncbi:hypothetical protein FNV43_RR27266 [Rhamnella rubrinervis]|uniref:DUF1985 domain-containing protein n=1 Tax=Rhamnella rubrinervis TaxID=2594499 RepID=A0A8K0DPN0_9ROSA|nr:hypothetical protein FNV43_RR27266 [Rhamnella rubrinervis]